MIKISGTDRRGPNKIHTVLTDNGIQFTTPGAGGLAVPLIKAAIANGKRFRARAFEYTCATNDIQHPTTKADSHGQLRWHLADLVSAYNFARRLKTLKGLAPYEFICKTWALQPAGFKLNPLQQMPGLNI